MRSTCASGCASRRSISESRWTDGSRGRRGVDARRLSSRLKPLLQGAASGQLRVVKVVPLRGPTYYLVDSNGDGTLDSSEGEGPISPVQYTLFEW